MAGVVLVILCVSLVLVLTLLYKSGDLEDGLLFTLTGGLVGSILLLIDTRWRQSHNAREPAKSVSGGGAGGDGARNQEQLLADIRAEIREALR